MAMPTPAEAAAKWAKNLGASTAAIQAGVQRVDVSPTEKAARKADAYLAGVQAAVQSGKWAAGLRRTTLQMWQDSVLKKGINRIAAGANAAIPKMQAFQEQFFPFLASVQSKVNAMPDATLEDRIAKSAELQRQLALFRRS